MLLNEFTLGVRPSYLLKNKTVDYSEGKLHRVMGVFVFIFALSNIVSSNSIVPSPFDDLSACTINFII